MKNPEENRKLIQYLGLFQSLDQVQSTLEGLSKCKEQQSWSVEVNNTLCKTGLNYQFYSMIFMALMALALFVLAFSVFLSENVIRGIYNEEIKYVKTNKQRFDWN